MAGTAAGRCHQQQHHKPTCSRTGAPHNRHTHTHKHTQARAPAPSQHHGRRTCGLFCMRLPCSASQSCTRHRQSMASGTLSVARAYSCSTSHCVSALVAATHESTHSTISPRGTTPAAVSPRADGCVRPCVGACAGVRAKGTGSEGSRAMWRAAEAPCRQDQVHTQRHTHTYLDLAGGHVAIEVGKHGLCFVVGRAARHAPSRQCVSACAQGSQSEHMHGSSLEHMHMHMHMHMYTRCLAHERT
jgi:hypothetical protein